MANIRGTFDATDYVTPDGRSVQEWHDTRGPSYLQDDIEKEFYGIPDWGYEERIEFMQHPHDFITLKDDFNEFVNCIKVMREMFTDELLVRLAKEVRVRAIGNELNEMLTGSVVME